MSRTLAVALACLLSCPAGAHSDAAVRALDFEQRLGQRLPLQAAFVDEGGRRAPLAAQFGREPVVLVLGYLTCPNLCDTTLAGVLETLRQSGLRAGSDYRALFVSIDPEDTTRGSANSKAQRVRRQDQRAWHFLTGGKASIDALAGAAGFGYVYDPGQRQYAHPAGFVVVTPQGVIARYFPGVRFEPSELRFALLDAANGKTGTVADRLLLLCRHLDPKGKHTQAIMTTLRAAVGLFLIAGGVLVWRASRRAPRKPAA
jgi:protein SCO1/2